MPHINDRGIKKKSMMGEDFRYYPLLRGIQDVPPIGDPVLLCTVGGIQYYLGPLNTQGQPNFNDDNFSLDELTSELTWAENGSSFEMKGTTPNFKQIDVRRLQKVNTGYEKLDNPDDENFPPGSTYGDLMFEGRKNYFFIST